MPSPVRVAVIGAGAFGRNHLRVLGELSTAAPERAQLAAVVDSNAQLLSEATQMYSAAAFPSVQAFTSVQGMLAALTRGTLALDAATVCVPTVAHARITSQLLAAGLDVLVEKPITATLEEADRLLAEARSLGRILAVGHLERFNPAVAAALTRLTRPMFFEAHRLSIFTPRSLDVDVVLDLMIHDLDILLTMAQSAVEEVRAVGLPVLSPKVDIANVRLEFASGAIANLTASRISTEQVRKLRLFQPAQYLSLDYARQQLLTINVDPALQASMAAIGPPAQAPSHPSAGLSFEPLDLPRAEPLRLELEDFIEAVTTRTAPRVTGEAARNALALALRINAAIADHTNRAQLT